MRVLPPIVLLCVLVPGLAAQRRVIPYPIPESREWAAAVKKGERTPEGKPGPAHWTDYARYELEAELDPTSARLVGKARLTYENRSKEPVRRLRVHVRQNLHKEGAVRNRPVEVTGGVTLGNVIVRVGESEPRNVRSRVRGTVLSIGLGQDALDPGGEAVVEMDWSFKVPRAGQAPRMGHERNHVYYLGYWYPQFAVREDVRGWVADPYMGGGEFYMGYADYDLKMTVPHGFIVRATGELQNPEEVLTETQRERLAKAAEEREIVHVVTADEMGPGKATQASDTGKLTWHFKAENVRDCAVSISDRYLWDATHAVVKDKNGPGKDGTCHIHAVYEKNARFWPGAADFCRHTIEMCSAMLYPYPWPHMTCCEGIIGGGMEYPMMTVIGTSFSRRGLYGVVSHETIHMWWPMIVGTNEKEWSWMDEGLTSYMTDLCSQDYFKGRNAGRNSATSYRGQARRANEVAAMRHSDLFPRLTNGMAYGFATYGKTAAVMHQLRYLLGPPVFDEAMRAYCHRWAFKHPHPNDLFNTFKDVTGEDLDWYFRTWFYETWTLDHAIGAVDAGPDRTRAVIKDLGIGIGPAIVRATYAGGRQETKRVPATHWLDGHREAAITFGPRVTKLEVDPDRRTLDIDPGNNTWEPETTGGR